MLAGIHITFGLMWLTVYAYFVSRLSELLSRADMKRRLERVTGALLVALGLRLVWERRVGEQFGVQFGVQWFGLSCVLRADGPRYQAGQR